jgi:hypothetical protein
MAKWIPRDMEWFLADLIQQFTFIDGSRSIYVNTTLVKAASVEEAYEKALEFGKTYNYSFTNADQEEVKVSFRGLRNLYLIYDKLEDGAELIYEEYDEATEEEIAAMVTPKEKLVAFEAHCPEPSETVTPHQAVALQ